MTAEIDRDLTALARKLERSTVGITAGRRGAGSGVVWSDGTVVTNAHVALTPALEVTFADGHRAGGRVERRDARRDLALVRVDTAGAPPADVRDPADLRAGEILVAFGHPLGVRNVLTSGIAFAAGGGAGGGFVRADVALAPGNSGGPLADAAGRVVGINSMVMNGLALAVPSDDVLRFLGAAAPPRLGVQLTPVRLASGRVAYAITAIERGSAAERSGLLPGDIVLARAVERLAHAPSITVLRGGVELAVAIVRGGREAPAAA